MSVEELTRLDEAGIAAWNAHDVGRFAALCADNIVWHDVGIPEPLHGKEGVRQFLEGWFTAFPDLAIEVKNRVVSGDSLAAEVEFTGTHTGPLQMASDAPPIPATGKMIVGRGTYFSTFRGGKLAENHTYPDAAGLMMQLGLIPE